MKMFESRGFLPCDTGQHEPGFDKIALYGRDGEFLHVALQLPTGRWTSKLGSLEDIEHDTLAALEGNVYGMVTCFMKRESQMPRLI